MGAEGENELGGVEGWHPFQQVGPLFRVVTQRWTNLDPDRIADATEVLYYYYYVCTIELTSTITDSQKVRRRIVITSSSGLPDGDSPSVNSWARACS